jgi:hypothetical protein
MTCEFRSQSLVNLKELGGFDSCRRTVSAGQRSSFEKTMQQDKVVQMISMQATMQASFCCCQAKFRHVFAHVSCVRRRGRV